MIVSAIFAILFTIFSAIVALFYLCLGFGAPWGEMAMGGKYPGKLPNKIRVVCFLQQGLYVLLCLIVLSRADLVLSGSSLSEDGAIYFVVALLALGTIMNLISPSKKERNLWSPVAGAMFISSLIVALRV